MLLYMCTKCGKWQDVTLSKAFQNALATFAQSSLEETGVLCPEGHGAMIAVQPTDRIALFEPQAFEVHNMLIIDRREIKSVLLRLKIYYHDRARIAGKHARECVDQQSMCDKAVAATRWEAMHDAVVKVAENLGIGLEEGHQ